MYALLKQADMSQKIEEEIGLSQRTYTVNPSIPKVSPVGFVHSNELSVWILIITRYLVPALKTTCNLPPMNCQLLSKKLFARAPTSSCMISD